MTPYDDTPDGYLGRARQCLEGNELASIFYAALELRFCVEARQNEYMQAQERYTKSLPPAHKIGHQAKALRKIFDRDEIQMLELDLGNPSPLVLYYTPVTHDLKNAAEKLGDLLHVRKKPRPADDPWWTLTKDHLVKTYRKASVACRGNLLTPLLLDQNGHAVGAVKFDEQKDTKIMEGINEKGRKVTLKVHYLSSVPPEFAPDL